jgi:16S rRNA (cytosine967-C5)-methyltransferase
LKQVREGGYANLAVKQVLSSRGLSGVDAGFVTELVYGTCRCLGTLDLIIEAAGGRGLGTLQPAVVDILRLGAYQLLWMDTPAHAAVSTSVDLAHDAIGQRATGVVNAIMRKVGARGWDEWMHSLTSTMGDTHALAVRTCHPQWIVEAYASVLPAEELTAALQANNAPATPVLVARPTLITREDLLTEGGESTPYSPWGVIRPGDPSEVGAVREGRAGVQDEGSQLVVHLLSSPPTVPSGPWLDLCAGPGGKAALIAGLARERGESLVAVEVHEHRAQLVQDALRGFMGSDGDPQVIVADGRNPSWGQSFARVLVDAPCTGLGSLRRRPEARWRKTPDDLVELTQLQRELLASACQSVIPGGVVAYVTCSPHEAETAEIVASVTDYMEVLDAPSLLPHVPQAQATTDPRFLQLWPHRHGTDAMFCTLLRKL